MGIKRITKQRDRRKAKQSEWQRAPMLGSKVGHGATQPHMPHTLRLKQPKNKPPVAKEPEPEPLKATIAEFMKKADR